MKLFDNLQYIHVFASMEMHFHSQEKSSKNFLRTLFFLVFVSVWIELLPVIGVSAGVDDGVFCLESEFFFSLGSAGIVFRDIAGSSWSDDIGNLDAGGFFIGIDEFQNGGSLSGSEVVDDQSRIREKLL